MMRIAIVGLVITLAIIGYALLPNAPGPDSPTYELLESQGSTKFSTVQEPREFSFPLDHGPHARYQTEWWYYTGNLHAENGDLYGYQLTIFRRGLTPGTPERVSGFATNQVFFGHIAITDVTGKEHIALESFGRGSAGLAGGSADPFAVYLGYWRIEALNDIGDKVRLQAQEGDIGLDLVLTSTKPIVAHGDGGYSPKGQESGNATYYLSFTDMDTEGILKLREREIEVRGSSWFDHEWGTSALGPDATGWDWFGLQLEDGRELMLFQIRTRDGGTESISGGTIIQPNGESQWLEADEMKIAAIGSWTSPETGTVYPSGWEVSIPAHNLELVVEPRVRDQEMRLRIEYWEGAVEVTGSVRGLGYVELTGYSGSMQGLF